MLSPLFNQIKKQVSQDRTRFQDSDFDLDLSYITNNLIAMAFPSSGLESAWRNSIDEVTSFLNKYHQGRFKIWNLSERNYDHGKFDNRVLDFGFPDHHPPPLELLFKIISSIHEYLTENEANVAVIHCTGGKGRTGTVIACYMVYCGLFETTDEALNYFAERRSKREKGVTQPSQRRYCGYFNDILSNQVAEYSKQRILKRIVFKPVPRFNRKLTGSRPVVSIYNTESYPKQLLFKSWNGEEIPKVYKAGFSEKVEIELNVPINADIMIKVSNVSKSAIRKKPELKFRFSFHTGFLPSSGTLIFKISEIDDCGNRKKFVQWFDASFEIRLEYDTVEQVISNNETFQSFMSARETRAKTAPSQKKGDFHFFDRFKIKRSGTSPGFSTGQSQEFKQEMKETKMEEERPSSIDRNSIADHNWKHSKTPIHPKTHRIPSIGLHRHSSKIIVNIDQRPPLHNTDSNEKELIESNPSEIEHKEAAQELSNDSNYENESTNDIPLIQPKDEQKEQPLEKKVVLAAVSVEIKQEPLLIRKRFPTLAPLNKEIDLILSKVKFDQ